jgi:hypothetical protein
MQIEEKMVNLAPAMAVTIEIKIGSRRIIEHLMSPVLRVVVLRACASADPRRFDPS